MTKGQILIIDDSALVRSYLAKMLLNVPDMELCDVASNGKIGFQKILARKPDVVILDLEMDHGDGLYVLQNIQDQLQPQDRPFVLIYSARAKHDDPLFRKAIEFGFSDFIIKVQGTPEDIISKLRKAFFDKLRAAIQAKKNRKISPVNPIFKDECNTIIPHGLEALPLILERKKINPKILIIGASTGGPLSVSKIMKEMYSVKVPVVVIQHMPEGFTKSFAEELGRVSGLPAHELAHNMSLEKGHIYVFPGGMHGKLSAFGNLFVFYADRQDYMAHPFKPSVNLAVESLVKSMNGHAIFAVLSGMGKDGGLAAKLLHDKGSLVIAQDKESSVVWGMPGAVVKENAADILLSQDELGRGIQMILKTYNIA